MGTTVDQFIKMLQDFRDKHPDNAKAEVAIERDTDIAFEFGVASMAVTSGGTYFKRFLVLSGNEKGDRVELRPQIQRQS
jgi:hypothetical protein